MTKILQISDMHLMTQATERYRDIDVEVRLHAVISHLSTHHSDAKLLLLTGDLVHQGGLDSYRRINTALADLNIHPYWIPRNYDCAETMATLWGGISRQVSLDGWRLTLLDSTADPDGRGSGALADSELAFLRQQLTLDTNHVVILHHNPIRVDSQWQQVISLTNAEEFNRILASSSGRGVVLFGHLHQHWDSNFGNWRMLGCPSTAVQFRKHCDYLELETSGVESWPGYRWLILSADGKIDTGVERCDPDQWSE